VDDDATVRALARRILAEAGLLVREAVDGAEALGHLADSPDRFHLVLTDVMMPRLNGVELLERLSVSHPTLPVILMSGYAPADLNSRGIAAPCSMLRKPFTPEELLAEVWRCLPSLC
jgi:CheY-like chemotaxis protein